MDNLSLDFINSERYDYLGRSQRRDLLNDPQWLQEFLLRWGLEPGIPPSQDTMQALAKLRLHMRYIADHLAAGKLPTREDLEEINRALAQNPAVRRLTCLEGRYALEIHPLKKDWNWVLGEIAASFAELLAKNDMQRIKICDNPDCRWVFYDESKNCTRRWCEKTCGNLMKVRKFRAKERKT